MVSTGARGYKPLKLTEYMPEPLSECWDWGGPILDCESEAWRTPWDEEGLVAAKDCCDDGCDCDILEWLWDAGVFKLLLEAVASGCGAAAERDARSACGEVTCSGPRAGVVEAVPVGVVVWSVTRAVEAMSRLRRSPEVPPGGKRVAHDGHGSKQQWARVQAVRATRGACATTD